MTASTMMSALTATKKFAKNGIDTPLPAPTPVFTVGSAAATVIYEMDCETDYAFPTIQLKVTYPSTEGHSADGVKMSSLIRQITISSKNFKEPMVIEGPALEMLPAAACALLTRLGQLPNFNSLYVDDGFGTRTSGGSSTESEAYIAIPAVLKPGKYQFEIQYSGYEPDGFNITNRSLRIIGTQRELAQDGLYFCPAAKRVINTVANGQGLGHWSGRYVVIGNPDVNGGLKGGVVDGVHHTNVGIRYNNEYMPTNDVIIEGVKAYQRALNPSNGSFPDVYQHPMDFSDITISRPTVFDVVIAHFYCVN